MTTGEISYTSDGNGNISITNMPAGMNASTDISGISIIKNGATAESKPLNDNFIYLDALITSAKTDMATQEATFVSNVNTNVNNTLSIYQNIVSITDASGDITLESNKVYSIVGVGNINLVLPVISNLDLTKYHQITVQLTMSSTSYSVNYGNVGSYFDYDAPPTNFSGSYNIYYEVDKANQVWTCGYASKGTIV